MEPILPAWKLADQCFWGEYGSTGNLLYAKPSARFMQGMEALNFLGGRHQTFAALYGKNLIAQKMCYVNDKSSKNK